MSEPPELDVEVLPPLMPEFHRLVNPPRLFQTRAADRLWAFLVPHLGAMDAGFVSAALEAIEREGITDPAELDVEAAVNTLMRAGFKSVTQARSVVIPMLAAALTGERHDLDDEFLTPEQRRRLARLGKS